MGNKLQSLKICLLTLLMLVVGFIGYDANKRAGLAFRFPAQILNISGGTAKELITLHNQEWRQYQCFLEEHQTFSDFQKCPSPNIINKPTLVLWGDSHAASLYPGYRAADGGRYNIQQRTAALCPPILGFIKSDRPNCKKLNDDIFDWISITKPSRVVLSAWWNDYDWEKVEATIAKLKSVGITQIDLVGPLPQWSEHLPSLVMKAFKADPLHRVPGYLNQGLKPNFVQLDPEMAAIAQRQTVRYLSPRQYLCKESSCLAVFLDPNASDPIAPYAYTAFDLAHLTGAGSRYLVAQFPKD